MVNSHAVVDAAATPRRYRNQATQRVLTVLLALADAPGPRGVSELSRALRMNKNMVHRALSTLVATGYAARDLSGELYQPGPRLLSLAPNVSVCIPLCQPSLHSEPPTPSIAYSSASASAMCAAFQPQAPCTPAPGCADADARYRPATGVR